MLKHKRSRLSQFYLLIETIVKVEAFLSLILVYCYTKTVVAAVLLKHRTTEPMICL